MQFVAQVFGLLTNSILHSQNPTSIVGFSPHFSIGIVDSVVVVVVVVVVMVVVVVLVVVVIVVVVDAVVVVTAFVEVIGSSQ